MSLIITKTDSNHSSSITSKSSSTPATSSYNMSSSSPAPPALLPLPDSKASSPGATQSGPDDLATSASPLQRIQDTTNSLPSQTSLPSLPHPPQRPGKAVLPPISQEQFDQYDNINTEELVKKVKEKLKRHAIPQRVLGDYVLRISTSRLWEILNYPKPWNMLTQKVRQHFLQLKNFLEDEDSVPQLVAYESKIAQERLMMMERFFGTTSKGLTFDYTTSGVKSSSTGNRSNSEINNKFNLSQDNLDNDRVPVEDKSICHHRASPRQHQEQQTAENGHTILTPPPVSSNINRRKQAMPQWVDLGVELSPENIDYEVDAVSDADDEEEEDNDEQKEIINSVYDKQTEDFELLLPNRVEIPEWYPPCLRLWRPQGEEAKH